MSYKKTDSIFIVTTYAGYMPQINTSGPIPYPVKVDIPLVYSMVMAGYPLYQIDPKTKDNVKLTIDNVYDDNKFGEKSAVVEPVVEETVVEEPVAPVLEGVKVEETPTEETPSEEIDSEPEQAPVVEETVVEKEPSTVNVEEPEQAPVVDAKKSGQKNTGKKSGK